MKSVKQCIVFRFELAADVISDKLECKLDSREHRQIINGSNFPLNY